MNGKSVKSADFCTTTRTGLKRRDGNNDRRPVRPALGSRGRITEVILQSGENTSVQVSVCFYAAQPSSIRKIAASSLFTKSLAPLLRLQVQFANHNHIPPRADVSMQRRAISCGQMCDMSCVSRHRMSQVPHLLVTSAARSKRVTELDSDRAT